MRKDIDVLLVCGLNQKGVFFVHLIDGAVSGLHTDDHYVPSFQRKQRCFPQSRGRQILEYWYKTTRQH